eukprot:3967823-Pyramimonas_sp.AAC.1
MHRSPPRCSSDAPVALSRLLVRGCPGSQPWDCAVMPGRLIVIRKTPRPLRCARVCGQGAFVCQVYSRPDIFGGSMRFLRAKDS